MFDLDQVNEYESLRKDDWVGFADVYLVKCYEESDADNKVDIPLYTKLVELDSKLGTNASEQLRSCINITTEWNFIKVFLVIGKGVLVYHQKVVKREFIQVWKRVHDS